MTLITFPHLNNAQRQQLFFRFIQFLLILKSECLIDGTIRNMQIVDERRI